ncbi:hypothetical protein [Serratia fonticola]|uniref:hypothetical protein n=1 Tax=Serratia fonticola TaxID=47917 RepID=UPI00301E6165
MYIVRPPIFPIVMLLALAVSTSVRAETLLKHSDDCLPAHLTLAQWEQSCDLTTFGFFELEPGQQRILTRYLWP